MYAWHTNTLICNNAFFSPGGRGRRLSSISPTGEIIIKTSKDAVTIQASLKGLEQGLTAPVAHGIEVYTGDNCENIGEPYFLSGDVSVNPWTRVAYESVGNTGTYELVEQQHYNPIKVCAW